MTKKVGFIGLGLMGGNMARRLLASGYEVVGYDVNQETAELLKNDGLKISNDIKEVVKEVEIICTSLPTPAIVNSVYLDEQNGILNNASEGTIILDFSTVDPDTTRKNYEYGKQKGVQLLDTPVSGGPRECFNGTLVIMVGGDQDAMQKVDDILNCLASTIYYAGPSGAGNIAKLINNSISMGTLLLSTEAFVLGVKAGVNADALFNILSSGGAKSHHLLKRFPKILEGDFEPGFKLALARKDLGLALDMSKMMKVPMTTLGTIYELFTAGSAMGLDDEDCAAIIKYFEQMAGVEARSAK